MTPTTPLADNTLHAIGTKLAEMEADNYNLIQSILDSGDINRQALMQSLTKMRVDIRFLQKLAREERP